jgi:hypothetical protein
VGGGDVAQAGREVDGGADVVVALEQDDGTPCHTGPQREGRLDLVEVALDLEDGVDQRDAVVDGHEHGAVAQPLGHAYAPVRCHLPHAGAEVGEQRDRLLVALGLGEGREATQVDESERPFNPHAFSMPCASWS